MSPPTTAPRPSCPLRSRTASAIAVRRCARSSRGCEGKRQP